MRFGKIAALLALTLALPANAAAGTLEVTFLDVGKADAFVLRTEESAVLIDSGTNKKGKAIVKFLDQQGIDRLDAMILTHFDKDHIGGADKVLKAVEVDAVYLPDYAGEGKQYRQLIKALDASQAQVLRLQENTSFALDGVEYAIDVANEDFYGADEENDFSLVTSVRYGDIRFLFAGDAENARLAELIDEDDLRHDVLKVPHHGVAENLSAAFFEAVQPRFAVITSSEDNPEDAAVVSSLESIGAQVYLTREGTVRCVTDGQNISFEQ